MLTMILMAALATVLVLLAAMTKAFFDLRKRHRACRHALNSARSDKHVLQRQLVLAEAERDFAMGQRAETAVRRG